MDKSRWCAVDSHSNNMFARLRDRRALEDGVSTHHVDSVLRVERKPSRDVYSFFLKQLGICLHSCQANEKLRNLDFLSAVFVL